MSVSLIDGHIDDDVPMKNNELKNCPFCGGEAVQIIKRIEGDNKILNILHGDYTLVQCKHCYASTRPFDDEKIAIEAWNRRVDNG